jgi:hypothetical protein
VSGYTRISASLALTLAIWLPTAITAIRHPGVDTAGAGVRFLLVFTLARLALRGIDRLIRAYAEHNGTQVAKGTPPVDVEDISVLENLSPLARRRSDGTPPTGPDEIMVDPLGMRIGSPTALAER